MLQEAGAAIVVAAPTKFLRIPTSPPSACCHLLVVECPLTALLRSFVAADDLSVLVAVFISARVVFAVVALLLCPSFVPLLLRQFRRRHMMTTPPKYRLEGTPPPRACLPPSGKARQFRRVARSIPRTEPPAATASVGGTAATRDGGGGRR